MLEAVLPPSDRADATILEAPSRRKGKLPVIGSDFSSRSESQMPDLVQGAPSAVLEQGVFLDHHATTPLDGRVLEAMLPYYGAQFGNPHSIGYARAEMSRVAVEKARWQVAQLIGAEPEDIIFTAGATEACNLALRGLFEPREKAAKGRPVPRLLYSAIEHSCVRETAHALQAEGVKALELPVDADGLIDLDVVEDRLACGAIVTSVMAANNEVGTLQPLSDLAALCHLHGCFFHTDAAQAVGKVPLDVRATGIDLLSLSGHKLYGPQGIGALYCSAGARRRLRPVIFGGGQERGLRPGTLPLALCVGLGEACRIAAQEMAAEARRLGHLRDALLKRLRHAIPELTVNGTLDQRLPGNLNVSLPGVEADALVLALGDVAISTGSACASGALAPSHVLRCALVDLRENVL